MMLRKVQHTSLNLKTKTSRKFRISGFITLRHKPSFSYSITRGGSRPTATSKVALLVITVNGWKPLTIITKSSTLDVAAVLDPPLIT